VHWMPSIVFTGNRARLFQQESLDNLEEWQIFKFEFTV
jgi:hypothetical protein